MKFSEEVCQLPIANCKDDEWRAVLEDIAFHEWKLSFLRDSVSPWYYYFSYGTGGVKTMITGLFELSSVVNTMKP